LTLLASFEDCCGDCPARIDVEPAPVAVAVASGKPVQALTHAAIERAAILYGFENLRMAPA
jgi:hypothetical protein